jgi:hypothetical protein
MYKSLLQITYFCIGSIIVLGSPEFQNEAIMTFKANNKGVRKKKMMASRVPHDFLWPRVFKNIFILNDGWTHSINWFENFKILYLSFP